MTGLHSDSHQLSEKERVSARQKAILDGINAQADGDEKIDHSTLSHIFDNYFTDEELETVANKNCQNLVGAVPVPLGVAGPVPVEVLFGTQRQRQNFYLPMATTEGALVASVQRGCKAITQAGKAIVMVEQKGMTRAPVFQCQSGEMAAQFLSWILRQTAEFEAAANSLSSHLQFIDLQGWVEGRSVFVRCRFNPDQAMGMNMVSIAIQRALDVLEQKVTQVHPEFGVKLVTLSSNVCTDKKQAAINRLLGRGWWVQAEVELSEEVLKQTLKTSSANLVKVHQLKNLVGSYLAGDAAQNMHVANMAVAMMIATGQDAAHVVDVSQGVTTVEQTNEGVYVAVTLPTVPVGVVGGGTWLPAQRQARQLITGSADLTSAQLAAAIGVGVLAGELSGLAALASHDLARAHQRLGRGEK